VKDKSNKDGGWTEALKACIIIHCIVYIWRTVFSGCLTMCACWQFLRRGHGGTAAFRRLIARPILKDIRLQDVVYAGGYPQHCEDAQQAATRAITDQLSSLGAQGKVLEKHDLQSVRRGNYLHYYCVQFVWIGHGLLGPENLSVYIIVCVLCY
jgi:hypothetical protein